MQLNQFENGIECQVNKVSEHIQLQGIHVQHEGAYSYTVGMYEKSLPELILMKGSSISDEKVEKLFVTLSKSNSRDEICGLLQRLTLRFSTLNDMEKRRRFYSARLYYGHWDFSAMTIGLEVKSE